MPAAKASSLPFVLSFQSWFGLNNDPNTLQGIHYPDVDVYVDTWWFF